MQTMVAATAPTMIDRSLMHATLMLAMVLSSKHLA